jgi:uncharacterized repeat protein (TIGR01451 family)
MPRLASRLFLLATSLLLLAQTHAQSIPGAFLPLDTRWIDQNNSPGTLYLGGPDLFVDRNGDGFVGPSQDPIEHITLPAAAQGALNYFLSPTREFLYVSTNVPQAGCTDQTLLFYHLIPASQPPTLVHQICLSCGVLNGGIPEFFDTGITQSAGSAAGVSSQRWALVRTGANLGGDPCGNPRLIFLDLNRPGASGRATIDLLHPGIGTTTVARSGNYVLMQHDLDSVPTNSDWALIDLCPATFGQLLTGPGFPFNDLSGPPVVASITSVSAGTLDLLATDGDGHTFAETLPDCLAASAPLGSCCVADGCVQATQVECAALMGAWQQGGSCTPSPCAGVIGACCLPGYVCTQLPQSLCSGTWTSGQPCGLATCPRPLVSLAVVAPASVPERSVFTISVTVRNDGNVAASNVVVTVPIPTGGNFVSATQGGVQSSGQVRWTLGPMFPGVVHTLTANVRGGCGQAFASIGESRVSFNQSPFIITHPALTIAQIPEPIGPIEATVVSTPSRVPLHAGDTILHTITLRNTIAQARPIVRCSISAGSNATIAQIIDLGGGVNLVGGNSLLSWEGSLGASATTSIVLVTRVSECLSPGNLVTALNGGNAANITDACNRISGTLAPQPQIAITPVIATTIGGIPQQIGIVGPRITSDGSMPFNDPVQAVRVGTSVAFDITVANLETTPRPQADFSIVFPSGLNFSGGSPLTGSVPPGTTWNSATRTARFVGAIPAQGSLTFSLGFTVLQAATRATIRISGGSMPGCTSDITGGLTILAVRELPANPFTLGIHGSRCLTIFDPVAGGGHFPLLDCPGEIYWSLTEGQNGDIWIGGLPFIRFNPVTLDMEIPGRVLRDALTAAAGGYLIPRTIEWDETTSTLIIAGTLAGQGIIARVDPTLNTVTVIQRDPALANTTSLIVDSSGRIVVPLGTGLRRLTPTGTLPLPAGTGEVLNPDLPAYSYTAIGTITNRRITWLEPLQNDQIGYTSVAEYQRFDGTPGVPPVVYTSVFGLSSFNPATLATTLMHPAIAASASGNPVFTQTVHPQVQPLLSNVDLYDAPFVATNAADHYLVCGRLLHEFDAAAASMTTLIPYSVFFLDVSDLYWYTPPAAGCLGDYNQDGGVDGSDVGAFFADWELGLANADVNQDGGVDGSDIGTFFDAWQAGC